MIKSMTGYGRRDGAWSSGSVTVEVRSVNHRFCEVVTRLPRALSSLEDQLKRDVLQRTLRGRIELTVSLQGERNGLRTLSLDRSLAKQYHRALRALQKEAGVPGAVDLSLLAGFRDIIAVTEQPASEDRQLKQLIRRLLRGALSDLDGMRCREGRALYKDIKKRIQAVSQAKTLIERRAPLVSQAYFSRMKARVEKLLGHETPDSGRLKQELAVYADRCDVTEEVTRLGSHLSQFDRTLNRQGSVGKTLDFLLQEMGREINTIGSKANDVDISMYVVKIKADLEKIREQVQNIE